MSIFTFIKNEWRNIPKTIFFNFQVFDFKTAIQFPVLISYNTKISEVHKGCIVLPERFNRFDIKIGIEGVEGVSCERKSFLLLGKESKLIFRGRASLSRGISIRTFTGSVEFGENFYSNCNLSIICAKSVTFGSNNLLGWDISIRDCDGHSVYANGKKSNEIKPVRFGDNVWIGSHVDILKGVSIADGSIIAYRSCVLTQFHEKNILIGGYPAKRLKEGVSWNV